jgi:ornithine cyclodeaminase/alanine dehydrogenase
VALLLDDNHVALLLDPARALAEVERAFRLLAEGRAVNEPRRRADADGTTVNVMWALAPTLDAIAVKSYPVVRADVSQAAVILVTLFSHATGQCLGIVQGDLLGQRRTAAATALATRLAARSDSTVLAVFGTGFQAVAQVQAAASVLPELRRVHVVGRDELRRDSFIASLADDLPHLEITKATPEAAVSAADVVVTATGSSEPVFDGAWLRPGTHVNAIGSNQAGAREIDGVTLQRAARVFVDSRAVAELESGDLLRNGFPVDRCLDLGDVVCGSVPGRVTADEITIFESHGLALLDLVCALRVLKAAAAEGLGHNVDWPTPMLPRVPQATAGERSTS